APTRHPLTDSGGGQEVGLELDGRERLTVGQVCAASDRGACVRQRNNRRREEEAGAGDQRWCHVEMPDDQTRLDAVEHAAELTGHEWTEERRHPLGVRNGVRDSVGHAQTLVTPATGKRPLLLADAAARFAADDLEIMI